MAILTAIEGLRTVVCRDLQQLANYLAPFRAGFAQNKTTTTVAYASAHPDEGFGEADTYIVPSLTRRIDLAVFGPANAILQWDDTGAVWEGGAEYPVGRAELWVTTRRVRIKSADSTAAVQCRYGLVFWC